MKKIIYSMFALMAMTFAACSDVPEPYMNPNNYKGGGESKQTTEPTGDGSIDNPFNSVAANNAASELASGAESSEKYYIKGKIVSIKENYTTQFGNATFYISDDGTKNGQFYVYRALYLGNKKYTAGDVLNVGDEVVVYGTLTNYGGTLETQKDKAFLYSLNGVTEGGAEGGDDVTPVDGGEGDGTEATPYNVTAAKAATGNGKYVKGFIVGYVDGKSLEEGAKFEAGGTTNILIATAADEKNVVNCMPIQLPTEVAAAGIRSGLNLTDNPTLLGKEIVLYGNLVSYFLTTGLKETSYAKVGDKEYGTKPGSTPVDPSGDKLYYIDFKTSQEGWTVQDVTLPAGFTHVWNVDTQYGFVATSFRKSDKTNLDGEGLIISPKIDLSKATAATLTVRNSGNYFESEAKMKEQIGVLISTDGTNWTPLEITTWPVFNKFTWVNSTFDLAAYAGKADVQIAFKYIGTATKAGTWEIGTVTIE